MSLRQIALGDFDHELAQTRRMLERVPEAHFEWRPHARSTPLGQLASHLAGLPRLLLMVLRQDGIDFAASPPRAPQSASSTAELLKTFDDNVAQVRADLDAASDEQLGAEWTLRRGEHVILRGTRATIIRAMGISHIVHHRGQLSVYLRLLDVPIPGLYGPSADER